MSGGVPLNLLLDMFNLPGEAEWASKQFRDSPAVSRVTVHAGAILACMLCLEAARSSKRMVIHTVANIS